VTERSEHVSVRKGQEREEKEGVVIAELKEMILQMEEVFADFEKGKITKQRAESNCFQIIEEKKNFFVLRKEDWGVSEAKRVYDSLKVWKTNSFLKALRSLRKKAQQKEMGHLQKELELLEDDVRAVVTHGKNRKTLFERVKDYISSKEKRRNPLFY